MKKVAVIEDEPPLSTKYCEVLELAGYQAIPFLTKNDAVTGVLDGEFDAWILDMKLGEDSYAGINLIGLAKEEGLKIPILVVSGLDPKFYRPATMSLGVWDFVPKAVEDETLIIKFKQLLDVAEEPHIPQQSSIDNLVLMIATQDKSHGKGTK